jgi:two-component system response regulator DesR
MGAGAKAEPPVVTCLVADDNEPVLNAIAALLVDEGVAVAGLARTGLEALRLLQQRPATAIVLDVNLPDLNGLEVARRAAEIMRKKTPIIFYTSYVHPQFVVQALDVGARGVVLKDAPPSNLLDAIAAVAAGGTFIDARLRPGPRRAG